MRHWNISKINDATHVIGRGDIIVIDLKKNKITEEEWVGEIPIKKGDVLILPGPYKVYTVGKVETKKNLLNGYYNSTIGCVVTLKHVI